MSASKYSTFLTLLTIFAISAAVDISDTNAETRLPVVQPEYKNDDQGKDLLSTLQELYHSLVAQIAVLETRQKSALTDDDKSETSHLIQHYTAQKNNIEHEISLIQSIEAAPTSAAVPRHILAHISPEEKIVPSLLNIFKKPKPSNDLPSGQFAYNAPYTPYYSPGNGPQFPYPYQGVQQHKPSYMDSLVQSSFPGYETQPNGNQQTFSQRNRVPPNYQSPEGNNSYLQVQAQFTAPHQVNLQGEVPQAPVQPQRVSSTYPTQPQVESTYKPQPHPAEAQNPLNANGQGVFIYYPNAVITEDDEQDQERPTIVDRVGQAFDRFGQVITNLATLQSLRSAANVNDEVATHKSETAPSRIRVRHNRPRSSSTRKVPTERTVDERKPKLRWVSV